MHETGQVGAIRLGISRALQNWEPGLRPQLREGITCESNYFIFFFLFSLLQLFSMHQHTMICASSRNGRMCAHYGLGRSYVIDSNKFAHQPNAMFSF